MNRLDHHQSFPVQTAAPSIDPSLSGAALMDAVSSAYLDPHAQDRNSAPDGSPNDVATLLRELERAVGPLS